ncbi:LIM homeobox transcription factor 1-beta-like [Chrysoperla carnea]|uniref:LIM homeobox transcription factor 1-beta-like n=1 Tax=Chrysoperla carnea TaxID=189513 RepID=UPI001D077D67|nr:LIM homeobox transcription factor 1-beta-like [Chrysoperla carnea]
MLEFYPNLNMAHMIRNGDPDTIQTTTHQCNGRPENLSTNNSNGVKCEVQQHHPKTYEMCEGCGQKIHDRYLMRVADASWHEHCLACCVCGVLLAHSCYTRNTKLYCKTDYDRIFGVKCSRCGDRLLAHEMVMRAQQHVYHLPCFVCVVCCQPLQKGEQFVLRAGQLFCRQDFEKEMYLLQQANTPEDDLLDDGLRPRDGRRGPKRPRTILTSAQRRQFKASFEVSPKPCRKVREALAKETGLSVRVVQVWFQNQRAKMKKIQRKAKQETDTKSSSDKDKDDNYPANSGDSFCSSDISLDDSTNFDHLDDGTSDTLSLQNLDLQTSHSSGHDSLPPGSIANPIDKLYLMQNSYFSTEQ